MNYIKKVKDNVVSFSYNFLRVAFFTIMIAIVSFLFSFLSQIKKKEELADNKVYVKKYVVKKQYVFVKDTFSIKKFKDYLLSLNVKFPHIIYAQAKMETANFSSNLFKNHNNLFGMKPAMQRPKTYSYTTDSGFAGYKNWKQSVMDYVLLQVSYMKDLKTEDEYYKYLSKNYADTDYYAKKVKELSEEFFTKS
jgi:uncharacterized FlgJ-related protein